MQTVCVCVCVGIYDTSYLFTIVLAAVVASPCGKQASRMVLISDMSQMVCMTTLSEVGETSRGAVEDGYLESNEGSAWEIPN